jgi:uncharacterized cupredoxin-like copper-binding protein
MKSRILPLIVIAACGVCGALAGNSAVVTVAMADFAYALSPRTVAAGPMTFQVKNVGAVQHDFEIVGHGKTAVLDAGGTEDMHIVLPPGTYEYRCTVPGHAEAGMKGMLEVR